MVPAALKPESFNAYPPEARSVAVAHLAELQQLPLSFLPSLLHELIDYDYRFPAERAAVDHELATLSALTQEQRRDWFAGFRQFTITPQLEIFDWVNQPGGFVEQFSAYLWTTHQQDAFRATATAYGNRPLAATPVTSLPARRLGIAVIGQGVASNSIPLFRKLRPHGTYFTMLKPDNGLALLLAGVAERAHRYPLAYGHWYVDGGQPASCDAVLTSLSWQRMQTMRSSLLAAIQIEIAKPGMGPEQLRTRLAKLTPMDIGLRPASDDILDRFQLKILTEGSGTQIFSTTFAQWTAREVLRRAQANTLLVRFAPRQRQAPMNELLANTHTAFQLDVAGSLVDADMGAYYQWMNQQRLPGAGESSFIAWFEDHGQAIGIGPTMPRNTESSSPLDLKQLLALVAS